MTDLPVLESAIPDHLLKSRTRQNRVSESFRPASKSYAARFDSSVETLVIAYLGIQFRPGNEVKAKEAETTLRDFLAHADGPDYFDRGLSEDQFGYRTIIFAAYWRSDDRFGAWNTQSSFSDWWDDEGRLSDGVGYFREVLVTPIDRLETIYGNEAPEGCAHVSSGMSGEIREHAYWGSARDRLAASQTDFLEGQGGLESDFAANTESNMPSGRRVSVTAPDNLCIVRFGQDLSFADEEERALYDEMVKPHLDAAMTYLEEKGKRLGCLANRAIVLTDGDELSGAKTYSLNVWQNLTHLERWAESHHTHLSIYVSAMKFFGRMRGKHKLRIYHEMYVVRQSDQTFEYVNCHGRTGLLNSI